MSFGQNIGWTAFLTWKYCRQKKNREGTGSFYFQHWGFLRLPSGAWSNVDRKISSSISQPIVKRKNPKPTSPAKHREVTAPPTSWHHLYVLRCLCNLFLILVLPSCSMEQWLQLSNQSSRTINTLLRLLCSLLTTNTASRAKSNLKITSLSSSSVLRNSVTPLISFEFINNASPYLERQKEDAQRVSGSARPAEN